MDTPNNTSNDTIIEDHSTSWTSSAVIALLFFMTGLICNTITVVTFLLNRPLWTPFNLYLLNLLLANVLYIITEGPLDFLNDLYTTWWIGRDVCNIYMYAMWVSSLVQITTHPLIAINRIWALTWPVSYRNHHNMKVAFMTCLTLWLTSHVIGLYGYVMDILYYRKVEDVYGCLIDGTVSSGQTAWMFIMQLVCCVSPMMCLIAYPVITYKERQRRKLSSLIKHSHQSSHVTTTVSTNLASVHPLVSATVSGNNLVHVKVNSVKGHADRSFWLLTVLTISEVLLVAPTQFYWIIQPFTNWSYPLLEKVLNVMYTLQSVLDPVLFALTLRTLRSAVKDTVCCRRKK